MTAADRLMAPRQSSPCKLLIVVLHANREHRRDAYATLGSAKCLTPRASTVHVVRHSTKLLSLTLASLIFGFPPRRSSRRHFAQRPAIRPRNVQTPEALRATLRSVLSLRDALADISQQHLARLASSKLSPCLTTAELEDDYD